MIAETLEIGVVLDPVSYSNTCFDCTFESIESAAALDPVDARLNEISFHRHPQQPIGV